MITGLTITGNTKCIIPEIKKIYRWLDACSHSWLRKFTFKRNDTALEKMKCGIF